MATMATQILKNLKQYMAEFDLSVQFRQVELAIGVEVQDDTGWGDNTRSGKGGLFNLNFSAEGFFEAGAGAVDQVLFDGLGVAARIITLAPTGGAIGERAYGLQSIQSAYSPIGGSVGDVHNITTAAQGAGDWFPGVVGHAKGAETATSNAAAQQIGAVTAAEKLYAALHVFAASGTSPTLDVKVQSDDAMGFPSATDRITFAQKTAVGSEFLSLAGPITDDWFRGQWTIGGTSPSFTFALVFGRR